MATVKPLVFNGPVETGLRALVLLFEAHPAGLDLQRLVTLDYLLVHSADVPGGPASIHPPSPLRAGEVAVRRRLVEDGLRMYRERGLLHQHATKTGFEFTADDSAASFLDSFTAEYVKLLRERATWVISRFSQKSDREVAAILGESTDRWRGEFALLMESDDDE